MGDATPWCEVVDEYTGDALQAFMSGTTDEFVTFLPYVQRFLYGEGHVEGGGQVHGSPVRVFTPARRRPRCAWCCAPEWRPSP